MLEQRILRDLEGQVGPENVYRRPADLAAYAYDAFGASGERHVPDAVVFPGSTDEVSGIVQVCAHYGVAVIPRGAGTGYCGGAVSLDGGVIVNLCRMSRLLGLEADAMRAHVEAGVITDTVQRRAAASGLYYPPDPGSATTSTLGGNVACNAGGAHSLRYGVTADYVVGATAVLASGEVVTLGEMGAGGWDLLRLLIGSEGTLGLVTEVLLRLVPAPAARATLAATFASMDQAVSCGGALMAAGLLPAALEVMDQGALDAVARAHISHFPAGTSAAVLVELEGSPSSVSEEASAARNVLHAAGALKIDEAATAAEADSLWKVRKAISAAVAELMIGKVNEDVVVAPDRVAELIAATREIGVRHDVPIVNFGHLGEGNIHATFIIDPRIPGERERADAAAAELFERVLSMDGSISGEHGIGCTKLPYLARQIGSETMMLMERIKHELDPRGLLNPGKKVLSTGVVGSSPAALVET